MGWLVRGLEWPGRCGDPIHCHWIQAQQRRSLLGRDAGCFEAAPFALGPLRSAHGHHMVLDLLQVLVTEGCAQLLLQGRLDLRIGDAAAVLGDQGDQGVGEVGAGGHGGKCRLR